MLGGMARLYEYEAFLDPPSEYAYTLSELMSYPDTNSAWDVQWREGPDLETHSHSHKSLFPSWVKSVCKFYMS